MKRRVAIVLLGVGALVVADAGHAYAQGNLPRFVIRLPATGGAPAESGSAFDAAAQAYLRVLTVPLVVPESAMSENRRQPLLPVTLPVQGPGAAAALFAVTHAADARHSPLPELPGR